MALVVDGTKDRKDFIHCPLRCLHPKFISLLIIKGIM